MLRRGKISKLGSVDISFSTLDVYFLLVFSLVFGSSVFGSSIAIAGQKYLVPTQENLDPLLDAAVNPDWPLVDSAKEGPIVAIFGEGLDLRVPEIAKSVALVQDESTGPRIGWDYVGNDAKPYPFTARSHLTDVDTKEFFGNLFFEQEKKRVAGLTELLAHFPAFGRFILPLERDVNRAVGNATRVRSYRVLPMTISFSERLDEMLLAQVIYKERLLAGAQRAIDEGAQYISISSVIYESIREPHFSQKLLKIVKENPNVVWVAAAGNDSRVFDVGSDEVLPLPCSVNEPNVICVGAEDAEGNIEKYSNKIVGKKEFMTAPGTNITSKGVVDRCYTKKMSDVLDISYPMERGYDVLVEALEECLKDNGTIKGLSGTSFSVPHALSEIIPR